MEKYIIEILPVLKALGYVGGGGLATLLLSKWLGKTKEEAEIVLNWEHIHAERDKKLLSEIKRLENKIDDLVTRQEDERIRHREEKDRWENSNMQLRDDLTKCRQLNGKLQVKIDRYEKNNL